MKYFLHSTDSFDDEKITELFLEFGYEGLGLFYTILEKIGKQEKPVKTTVLKAQLKVGKKLEKCWQFMEEIGIISSNNGDTFNERILSYSETYQIKKEKTREKVSQWREKQALEKNVTGYVPVSNPPKVKESKVKESKVKESKVNIEEAQAPKPPTEKKSIPKLFRECQYFEKENLINSFSGTPYQEANIDYYHEVVLNWSDSKAAKKIDWLATMKNWMAKDITEGKFISKNFKVGENGNSKNGKQQTGASVNTGSILSRVNAMPD